MHNIYSTNLILFLGLVVLLGCKKDQQFQIIDNHDKVEFSILEAQSWFNKSSETLKEFNSIKSRKIEPIWSKAKVISDQLYDIIECPLENNNTSGFIVSNKKISDGKNEGANGITRLLILKNKNTGFIHPILMHVYSDSGIPDETITYSNRPNYFSGNIFFTNIENKFINGWIYEKGKIIRKSNKKKSNNITMREGPGDECEDVATNWYTRTCYYYLDGSSQCTGWTYTGTTYENYCSGSGGGGYTGDNYESNYENQNIIDSLEGYPCAQDILKNLPNINSMAQDILLNVFGINEDINIKFTSSNLPSNIDGETDCSGASSFFNCNVSLNSMVLNNASKDYIAAIFIHEAVHAYIMHQKTILDSTAFKAKFPIYWEYRGNDAQHNEMANNYVSSMANVIKGFNNTLTDVNARALAWGGLQMTTAWQNNPDTNYIKQINAAGRNILTNDYLIYGFIKCP